jgi:O-antigen ligase
MNKVIELVLVLVLIGATLAFGGVQPITYSLAEIVLFLALLLVVLARARQGEIKLHVPWWPVLFALLVAFQVIPLPSPLILGLSPMRALDANLAALPHGQWVWATLSIYPHQTLLLLLKFLACLTAFVLAAEVFDSGRGKSTLVRTLIILGCFEAAYGIIQYLTGWQKIFTFIKQYDTAEATGTYINRNHFAGLLELTAPFAFAAAFYAFQRWLESRRASRTESAFGLQAVFYLFLMAIMVVGVVFSRSRGGILATVFAIIFIALLAQLKARQKAWMLGVFLLLVCVMGYGLWIGLDPVLARYEEVRQPGFLQMEGRISIWKESLRLVRDSPLTGTGLGTFAVAYRRVQTGKVEFYVDHAHSDYLEFAADTGLLGAALLFLPILFLLIKMVSSFLDDPRRYRRAVTLGCIGSTLALMAHSVTDFNLQIPANAIIFAVVLGLGYKATCIERREGRPR